MHSLNRLQPKTAKYEEPVLVTTCKIRNSCTPYTRTQPPHTQPVTPTRQTPAPAPICNACKYQHAGGTSAGPYVHRAGTGRQGHAATPWAVFMARPPNTITPSKKFRPSETTATDSLSTSLPNSLKNPLTPNPKSIPFRMPTTQTGAQ